MKRELIILGAGKFARELHSWAVDWISLNTEWSIKGFLSDNQDDLSGYDGLPPIISSISEYSPTAGEYLVCGITRPADKVKIIEILLSRGAFFTSMIHPTAIIAERAKIGVGVIAGPYSVVSVDSLIGNFVTINIAATVGHDTKIGDYSTLSGHCDVTGGAVLGECVFMGSHAVVLPGVEVEAHATVGAGSTVIRRALSGSTVFGVPAKTISREVK